MTTHLHICPNCGHSWSHGPECFGDKATHTCSKCGCLQWVGIGPASSFGPARQGKPGFWMAFSVAGFIAGLLTIALRLFL